MSFSTDARVFVKHPKKSWVPGFVTSRDAKTGHYTITDDDHDEVTKVPEDNVTLCREDLLNEGIEPLVHDLLFLTVLHDATLLRCLRVRYMKDIIYTNIGAIVVALNPFNFKIPWYMDSQMEKYLAEGDMIRHNLPHSWAVAHNTYHEMMESGQAQTILVSGESGAGKTEACKIVMKYLGAISMGNADEEKKAFAENVRVKILQASPILEGFGNAKTVRNNNSSRFGKFVKIKFHDGGSLVGANTINYLLEKSRIITAAQGERVYHAFYLVSKGAAAGDLGLKGPQEYRSTAAGKCFVADGEDDAQNYNDAFDAMGIMGMTDDERKNLWKTVAACLVNQNVDLSPIDKDTTQVAEHSMGFLGHACNLWGISPDDYVKELLTTTGTVRGESFTMNHKLAQAVDMRDSVTKHMYDKLFSWLVNKINLATDDGGEVKNWIGLLDIFGFEDFEVNSFEQVCINLTNETLQNHYNNYIFKRDMEECRAEGVCVEDIKCPDNSDCLKLVADQSGVLGLLDDECRLGTGTDEGFLEALTQSMNKNEHFVRKPMMKSSFIVKHYAGDVQYQVKNFLEKNRDTLKDDFKLMMGKATNPFACQLLPPPDERTKKITVGGFFKLQLAELMFLINSTNPHWIRCVKPHPAKKPLMFDGVQVTNQLESSGVLGTVKIRKAGYPVRLPYAAFLARYKILLGRCSPEEPLEVQKEAVRKAMKASKTTSREVQLGKTRVFMKSEAYFVMEKCREEAGIGHRLMIQAHARCVLSQVIKRRITWTSCANIVQEEFRDYLRRSEAVRAARRKAKQEMLAAQAKARSDFVDDTERMIRDIFDECDSEYKDLFKTKEAHRTWIEDKQVLDLEERLAFVNMESRERQDIMMEFKGFLATQRPMKAALHALALPEVELHHRKKMDRQEDKEFNWLEKMFAEHGAALFRLEIERTERRMRRLLLRIEDLEFGEAMQRCQFLPEYLVSLNRAAHPFGSTLEACKHYAETVARRRAKRRAQKEQTEQVDYFTNRRQRDHTRLAKELAAIQVGTKVHSDPSYCRMGDKTTTQTQFAAKTPWRGVSNVPDLDQVLAGMKAKGPRDATRTRDPLEEMTRIKASDIKHAGVFEKFRDKNDEMQFLRMRHLLSRDFRLLQKEGHYSGPFVHETEISDRRQFYSARDELQTIVQGYSEQLVHELRQLNAFCSTRHIPEQDRVTGEWFPCAPVAKELMAKYPPCTDWRLLKREIERLQYATRNYKKELLKIVSTALDRGAKLAVEDYVDAGSNVEKVHSTYFKLRGHFETCSRCLFPMATRHTLVQLRTIWPHVQDSKFPERCKDCATSVFVKGLTTTGIMPAKTFNFAAAQLSSGAV